MIFLYLGSVKPTVCLDNNNAAGQPNTPQGIYDPLKDKAENEAYMRKLTYNLVTLKNMWENSLRDDKDGPLTAEITNMYELVANNVQFPSTEGNLLLKLNSQTKDIDGE